MIFKYFKTCTQVNAFKINIVIIISCNTKPIVQQCIKRKYTHTTFWCAALRTQIYTMAVVGALTTC